MTAASRVKPQNSERDAHRLFDRFWLSLRVPISYIQVESQEDGMHSSIPCYKAFLWDGGLCAQYSWWNKSCTTWDPFEDHYILDTFFSGVGFVPSTALFWGTQFVTLLYLHLKVLNTLWKAFGVSKIRSVFYTSILGSANLEQVRDMATYLLQKHPELLLGGDSLGPEGCKRCSIFWERFRCTQQDHCVYEHFSVEQLGRVIPLCIHGDKGRTLRKSAIACYSFEAVFGLPEHMRETAVEPSSKKSKKHHDGQLGMSCGERKSALSVPLTKLDASGACTVELRRQQVDTCMSGLQTHNTLGLSNLLQVNLSIFWCFDENFGMFFLQEVPH